MGFSEQLRLLMTADTGGAVRGIEKVGAASKAANQHVKASQSSLDKWGRGLTTAGAGMVGFGAVALAGLKTAAGSASDLAEMANKSQAVFGRSAGAVDRFAGSAAKIGLSKRAALEAASGFGNLFDQVGLASDSSARMSVRMTRLAADFASFHNADISDVVEAQTAAFRGEYDALQRFVPTINAAAVQQQAMADTGKKTAAALTEAEKATAVYELMVRGAGKATGDFERTSGSAANQQRKLSAEFENLKAQIGEGALPVMRSLLSVTTGIMHGFSGLNEATGDAAGKIATIGAVGLTAAGGLSFLVGQAITMRKNFALAAQGVSGLVGKLGGLGAVGAFTGATVGVGLLTAELEHLGDEADRRTIDKVTGQLNRMGSAFDPGLTDRIKAWAKAGREADVNVVFKNFSKVLDESVPAARRFVDVVDHLDASTKRLIGAKTIERMRDAVDEKVKSDVGAAAAQSAYTDEINKGAGAMDTQAEATGRATAAAQEYLDAQAASLDPLFGATDALMDNAKAQDDVRAKTLLLAAAERDHGKGSAEAQAAQAALTEAQLAAGKSALSTDAALRRLKAGLDDGTVSVDDAKAAIRRMRADGLIPAGSTADVLAGKLNNATRKAEGLGRADPTVNVKTAGINKARTDLAGLKDKVDRFPTFKQVTIHFAATGTRAVSIAESKLLRAGFRAAGGPVRADKAYVVGESGPELFVPDESGRIIANGGLNRVSGGAGMAGAATYVTNIHVGQVVANDPHQLVEALRRYTKVNGPLPLRVRA